MGYLLVLSSCKVYACTEILLRLLCWCPAYFASSSLSSRFDYDEFAIMVASRWSPEVKGLQMAGDHEVTACLESVRLSTSSSFDKDTDAYRRLQNMKMQGLDLIIEEEHRLIHRNYWVPSEE